MRTMKGVGIRRLVFWGIGVILAANLGRLVYQGAKVRAATERPYTVVRTERGFDKDGTLRYTNQYTEALRTDGAKMWQATTSVVQQRRINFANGDEVLTNEILGRRSTYPRKHFGVPGRRDPATSCYGELDAKAGWVIDGIDSISGHRAIRLAFTRAGRNWRTWYALDSACAVLQMHYEEDGVRTLQELTSFTVGQPDPNLFDVPAAFQEVPPSALFERTCRDGNCTAPLPDTQKQRLDKTYFDLRARGVDLNSGGGR
jgi:hypothetical protein